MHSAGVAIGYAVCLVERMQRAAMLGGKAEAHFACRRRRAAIGTQRSTAMQACHHKGTCALACRQIQHRVLQSCHSGKSAEVCGASERLEKHQGSEVGRVGRHGGPLFQDAPFFFPRTIRCGYMRWEVFGRQPATTDGANAARLESGRLVFTEYGNMQR